jgi:hypothetical protein
LLICYKVIYRKPCTLELRVSKLDRIGIYRASNGPIEPRVSGYLRSRIFRPSKAEESINESKLHFFGVLMTLKE